MTMQDGIRAVQQAFAAGVAGAALADAVRQAKQFLKTGIEGFDERKYGFASVVDSVSRRRQEAWSASSAIDTGRCACFPAQADPGAAAGWS